MNRNVYLAMLIFCSYLRLTEESNFVTLSFTRTTQKKCKSIILSKESFYNTKHLKFNTLALLLRCSSNLSATASGGVQKYSNSCVFVLEVVLMIQKYSEFKHLYIHPEVIE